VVPQLPEICEHRRMTDESISLNKVLATFADLWSPRIVATINDYDVRVAKFLGEYIWHAHDNTDEFFLVLDGELQIALRDSPDSPERRVTLPKGSVYVVPRGVEHKPITPGGASILMFEPNGTMSVGDRHDEVPDHIEATTGHLLSGQPGRSGYES
jgi:mannose-6-phosphate isomerase-like protein (cupin superfamily)